MLGAGGLGLGIYSTAFYLFLTSGPSVPRPPKYIRAAHITANSIDLEWAANWNGGACQKFFIRVTNVDPQEHFVREIHNIPEPPEGEILYHRLQDGLAPDTAYNVEIWAENDIGRSIYSSYAVIRTDVPPSFNVSSMKIMWTSKYAEVKLLWDPVEGPYSHMGVGYQSDLLRMSAFKNLGDTPSSVMITRGNVDRFFVALYNGHSKLAQVDYISELDAIYIIVQGKLDYKGLSKNQGNSGLKQSQIGLRSESPPLLEGEPHARSSCGYAGHQSAGHQSGYAAVDKEVEIKVKLENDTLRPSSEKTPEVSSQEAPRPATQVTVPGGDTTAEVKGTRSSMQLLLETLGLRGKDNIPKTAQIKTGRATSDKMNLKFDIVNNESTSPAQDISAEGQEESSRETKAESPSEEKSAESPTVPKPAESPVEIKPAESPVEAKPAESLGEPKPTESLGEPKPAGSPVETKPAESPGEPRAAIVAPSESPKAPGSGPKYSFDLGAILTPLRRILGWTYEHVEIDPEGSRPVSVNVENDSKIWKTIKYYLGYGTSGSSGKGAASPGAFTRKKNDDDTTCIVEVFLNSLYRLFGSSESESFEKDDGPLKVTIDPKEGTNKAEVTMRGYSYLVRPLAWLFGMDQASGRATEYDIKKQGVNLDGKERASTGKEPIKKEVTVKITKTKKPLPRSDGYMNMERPDEKILFDTCSMKATWIKPDSRVMLTWLPPLGDYVSLSVGYRNLEEGDVEEYVPPTVRSWSFKCPGMVNYFFMRAYRSDRSYEEEMFNVDSGVNFTMVFGMITIGLVLAVVLITDIIIVWELLRLRDSCTIVPGGLSSPKRDTKEEASAGAKKEEDRKKSLKRKSTELSAKDEAKPIETRQSQDSKVSAPSEGAHSGDSDFASRKDTGLSKPEDQTSPQPEAESNGGDEHTEGSGHQVPTITTEPPEEEAGDEGATVEGEPGSSVEGASASEEEGVAQPSGSEEGGEEGEEEGEEGEEGEEEGEEGEMEEDEEEEELGEEEEEVEEEGQQQQQQ